MQKILRTKCNDRALSEYSGQTALSTIVRRYNFSLCGSFDLLMRLKLRTEWESLQTLIKLTLGTVCLVKILFTYVLPAYCKMFQTVRYFRTHAQTDQDIEWGTMRQNFQFFSARILTSDFAVFFLFSALRLDLEYPDELWRCLSCFDTLLFLCRCHTREERKPTVIFSV